MSWAGVRWPVVEWRVVLGGKKGEDCGDSWEVGKGARGVDGRVESSGSAALVVVLGGRVSRLSAS